MKRCPDCETDLPPQAAFCIRCGKPQEPAQDELVGHVLFGRYRVLERIAQGATSRVYRVQHGRISQLRAVKVLDERWRKDPRAAESFWREARIAARVRHPSLALLHDADTLADGTPASVWELVEGPTLAERVRKAPLGPATSRLARGLLGALEALHRHGFAHLDVCPDNVILGLPGQLPRLVDLGESRQIGGAAERCCEEPRVGFTAPEQLAESTVRAESDVFAVGSLLCFAYTGKNPFPAPGVAAYAALLEEFKPGGLEALAGLPAPLRRVVARCLAREPDERPADASAVREAIRKAARLGGLEAWSGADPEAGQVAEAPPPPAEVSPRGVTRPTVARRPPKGRRRGDRPAVSPEDPEDSGPVSLLGEDTNPDLAPEGRASPARQQDAGRRVVWLQAVEGVQSAPRVLGSTTTSLGRSSRNDIPIENATVSKRHGLIRLVEGEYRYEDLGSRNGSSLNEVPVRAPVTLRDGDWLSLGEVVFRIRVGSEP